MKNTALSTNEQLAFSGMLWFLTFLERRSSNAISGDRALKADAH